MKRNCLRFELSSKIDLS